MTNYLGTDVEHYENDVNNTWAIACLEALYGTFDVEGGSLDAEGFGGRTLTLYDEIPLRQTKPIAADRIPMLYDFRRECDSMSTLDAILGGDPYPLKEVIMRAASATQTIPRINQS